MKTSLKQIKGFIWEIFPPFYFFIFLAMTISTDLANSILQQVTTAMTNLIASLGNLSGVFITIGAGFILFKLVAHLISFGRS